MTQKKEPSENGALSGFFLPFISLLPNETVMDFHDYLDRFIFLCSILLAKSFALSMRGLFCLLHMYLSQILLRTRKTVGCNLQCLTPKWIGLGRADDGCGQWAPRTQRHSTVTGPRMEKLGHRAGAEKSE